jgi:hypothetical protein
MVDAQSLRAAEACRRDARSLRDAGLVITLGLPGPNTGAIETALRERTALLIGAARGLTYAYETLWEKEATDAAISYWSRTGRGGHIIDATNVARTVIQHLGSEAGLVEAKRCAEVAWYIATYLKRQANQDRTMLTPKEAAAGIVL